MKNCRRISEAHLPESSTSTLLNKLSRQMRLRRIRSAASKISILKVDCGGEL